ncbi:Scavenger receptor class A member 5 [Chelonia mydas]|uniref:Scavenger receptor class A member 5 n=1 Tax=Chelonia mydas TaxID=8469 RepID=M7AKM4_CHEMY|nr:Scavenger receptor class A member 5 [Chelonia mydas]
MDSPTRDDLEDELDLPSTLDTYEAARELIAMTAQYPAPQDSIVTKLQTDISAMLKLALSHREKLTEKLPGAHSFSFTWGTLLTLYRSDWTLSGPLFNQTGHLAILTKKMSKRVVTLTTAVDPSRLQPQVADPELNPPSWGVHDSLGAADLLLQRASAALLRLGGAAARCSGADRTLSGPLFEWTFQSKTRHLATLGRDGYRAASRQTPSIGTRPATAGGIEKLVIYCPIDVLLVCLQNPGPGGRRRGVGRCGRLGSIAALKYAVVGLYLLVFLILVGVFILAAASTRCVSQLARKATGTSISKGFGRFAAASYELKNAEIFLPPHDPFPEIGIFEL